MDHCSREDHGVDANGGTTINNIAHPHHRAAQMWGGPGGPKSPLKSPYREKPSMLRPPASPTAPPIVDAVDMFLKTEDENEELDGGMEGMEEERTTREVTPQTFVSGSSRLQQEAGTESDV